MSRSQDANVKIVFDACLRQKWVDLCKTKTKLINGSSYTYRQIYFISGNASFL